jgi:hypothetical protein
MSASPGATAVRYPSPITLTTWGADEINSNLPVVAFAGLTFAISYVLLTNA